MSLTPITRVENFLARIAGDPGAILTPIPRIEKFLQRIIDVGGGGGSGLSDTVKDALLDCFANVAWATEDGQQYYDALETALYPIDHITAVYTQSGTVYDTDSLDSLKSDLVVTAFYAGGSAVIRASDYTLSGTLTVGTSTITVNYKSKTATFTVTVTEHPHVIDLDENDFFRGMTNKTPATGMQQYPYAAEDARRICYYPCDLEIEGGKTYKITATSTYNTAQMGVLTYNEIVKNAYNQQESVNLSPNSSDSGWQGLVYTITTQQELNGSPVVGVRFSFRQSIENPDISDDFKITRLVVEEVVE